jgi:alkanesulfonate monooxygenase SsuD/methylene tetrahydromethanopterin reductase-like flavin-dependent oxidoreductase (luciferase family)
VSRSRDRTNTDAAPTLPRLAGVLLGASLRSVYPTDSGPFAYQRADKNVPPGGFLETAPDEFRPTNQANRFIALAHAIRDADLDLLLVGDRHAAPVNAFAPVPLIARLQGDIGRVPLGCVFLAPFHHPVVLAEQLGTLAAFHSGPFTATFTIGDTEEQFSAFGMALKSRTVRTDEVVEIVRRLLAGETVSFAGRYHRLENVAIGPLPETPIRIWVGGRRGAAVERAGRLGDAWVTDTRTPQAELVVELRRYQDAAVQHNRPVHAVVRRNVFLAETDREAHELVGQILRDSYRGLDAENVLVGSPQTVTEQLLALGALGFDMTVVRHLAGDHERTLASIGMLGSEVLPALRREFP